MKKLKFLTIILFTLTLFAQQSQSTNAAAQCIPECDPSQVCEDVGGSIGKCVNIEESVIPTFRDKETDPSRINSRNVEHLPDVTWQELVATIIKTALGFTMILTLIALVYAGVLMLMSRGNEDEIGKAKGMIIYLLVGIFIMASAYGIIVGISKFNFLGN